MRYLACGGHGDVFDVEAHLQGIAGLSSFERDVLAYALNERLDELYRTVQVPYLTQGVTEPLPDLETVIDELLDAPPRPPPPGVSNIRKLHRPR